MEVIKKQISIEPFKNRYADVNLPLADTMDISQEKWGKIVKDIVVDNVFTDYKKTLPLITNIDGKLVLRFRRAIEILLFVKKFVNNSCFYSLCKRGDNSAWIENKNDILSSDEYIDKVKGIYRFKPSVEGFAIGNIIWVGDEAEEFLSIFRLEGDSIPKSIKAAKALILYVWSTIYGNQSCETSDPYLPVPIMLTQDYNDIGLLSMAIGEWIPNKKYYIGEKVIYEGDTYILKYAVLEDINGKYYKGNFVEKDKTTYFDDIGEDRELILNHWGKMSKTEEVGSEITGYTESRLSSLMRYKKEYDDDGNELPFIFPKDEFGNIIVNDGIVCGEILYSLDLPFNIRVVEGFTFYDYISKITSEDGKISFEYYIGSRENEEESGVKYFETYPYTNKVWEGYYEGKKWEVIYKSISYVNQLEIPELETEEGKLYAKISYQITNEKTIVEGKSLYHETYNKLGIRGTVDGETVTCVSMSNFIIEGGKSQPFLANHDYTWDHINDKWQEVMIPIIKRDSLMGIQNYAADTDNLKIIRGKAAAFELHNILGEVRTFEDLETYRNDFFNVKA